MLIKFSAELSLWGASSSCFFLLVPLGLKTRQEALQLATAAFNFLDGKRHGCDLLPCESVISSRATTAGPSEHVHVLWFGKDGSKRRASWYHSACSSRWRAASGYTRAEAHCHAGVDTLQGSPQTASWLWSEGGRKASLLSNFTFCSYNAALSCLFLTTCTVYLCSSHYFLF